MSKTGDLSGQRLFFDCVYSLGSCALWRRGWERRVGTGPVEMQGSVTRPASTPGAAVKGPEWTTWGEPWCQFQSLHGQRDTKHSHKDWHTSAHSGDLYDSPDWKPASVRQLTSRQKMRWSRTTDYTAQPYKGTEHQHTLPCEWIPRQLWVKEGGLTDVWFRLNEVSRKGKSVERASRGQQVAHRCPQCSRRLTHTYRHPEASSPCVRPVVMTRLYLFITPMSFISNRLLVPRF